MLTALAHLHKQQTVTTEMFVELVLILLLWSSYLTCTRAFIVGVLTTVNNYAYACAQVVAKTRSKRVSPTYAGLFLKIISSRF